jgi:hypothetical protein
VCQDSAHATTKNFAKKFACIPTNNCMRVISIQSLDVLKKTLVEAGKGKTPKGLKELCKEEGNNMKSMKPLTGIVCARNCAKESRRN